MSPEEIGSVVSVRERPSARAAVREHAAALRTPAGVHYLSLAVAFVALLVIGRDQWFFGDDWAILVPRLDDDVLVPHVGHWNLVPAIVFPLLREWLGLSDYLPFLALAVAAHIVVAHLTWRILERVGVSSWLATALGILMLFFGGGAENIFWAFQFGFMGAIACGLGVVLLLDRERVNLPAVVGLSVIAPMFSGTAIPLLAAAAVVGSVRLGVLKTVLLLLPTAVVYLTWYVIFAVGRTGIPSGISDLRELRNAVVYAAAMYGGGLGRGLPWIGLGVLPAAAAAVWFVVTIRRGLRSRATMAYALIIGSVVFVGLTTYSRLSLGIYSAIVERYAYLTLVLLLPALGLLLTGLLPRGRVTRRIIAAALALLIAFNMALLVVGAATQAGREKESRDRIGSALEVVEADPGSAESNPGTPDSEWSPDLMVSDMAELYEREQLSPSDR